MGSMVSPLETEKKDSSGEEGKGNQEKQSGRERNADGVIAETHIAPSKEEVSVKGLFSQ